jgi:hypothetical protein
VRGRSQCLGRRRGPFHLANGAAAHFYSPALKQTLSADAIKSLAFHTYEQVDDGVVTLVNGWVVASTHVPFIDLSTVPSAPSSVSPPSLPLPAPLDIFRFEFCFAVLL